MELDCFVLIRLKIYLLVYNILFIIPSDSIPLKDVIYTECELRQKEEQ